MGLVIFEGDLLSWFCFCFCLGLTHLELVYWLSFPFVSIFHCLNSSHLLFSFSGGVCGVQERTKLFPSVGQVCRDRISIESLPLRVRYYPV